MSKTLKLLSFPQILLGLILVIAFSSVLAVGFIPTSNHLFGLLWNWLSGWIGIELSPEQQSLMAFPALAALFFFSLPTRKQKVDPSQLAHVWRLSLLPLAIAIAFGFFHPSPSLFSLQWSEHATSLLWFSISIPIGEELLFRGWVYDLCERVFPNTEVTLTNPLPIALWVSSISFSLWHLQNLGQDSTSFVLFQVLYTFFTGLWLGYVRWKTGRIWIPIVLHMGVNTLSNLL